jgi:hypothetical protein
MDRSRRVFFLLLINLILVFLSLYILDFLQIIDYRQILSRVPLLRQAYVTRVEDPFLWERMILQKQEELLNEKVRNYEAQLAQMVELKLQLDQEWEKLAEEKQNVQNMIDNFNMERQQEQTYDQKVLEVAMQIKNMPPAVAVKVIEKQDDLMIADIFRALEKIAEDEGTGSVVPGITRLMDPEQLARVQRKMLSEQ